MNLPGAEPSQLMQQILFLSERVSMPLKEDELLRRFTEALVEVFPGCNCCLRLIDPKSGALTGAYAVGLLDPQMREYLFITPDCFEAGDIPIEIREALPPGLHVIDKPGCIFRGGVHCAAVALCRGAEIYGLLHLETSRAEPFSRMERMFLFVAGSILSGVLSSTLYLKELRYLRDYMNKLIDHANVPIVVLDAEHKIKSFNQAMEHITGYSKEDVTGSDFFNLMREQDRGRFAPVLMNALQGRSTAGFEVHIPRKDGRESIPMALNVASVEDMHGGGEDAVVIGQDLTEVRRLQNQMLHSERLVTIGQLSAGVVHEINNPLTSISVYSEYLLKKYEKLGIDEGDLTRLKRIVSASDRILKFTRELMNYARPAPEEPTLVDVREVANHAVGFCEHVISTCAVTVKKEFPELLPPVYGIKGQLQQVFVNLITNACHAMKETGGELTVRINDNRDGTIRAEIADTGTGMPRDILGRAFDPFFTTKAEGEGTGLGLSIVKNIIQNHQGDIRIRSEVGKGTTVSVILFTLE
jgi:two-component system NtrC family sensor kinase